MVRARASTMAVARVERRPNRMGQFFSVALMFMLLKSTQESFGRAYRGRRGSTGEESPRGAHGRGGVVPKGARVPGAHRGDARAALTVDTPWTRSSRDGDGGDPGADAARADADPDPSRVLLSNATSASLGAPANDDGTFVFPEDISGTFKGHWSMVTALGDDGTPNGTTTPNLPGMRASSAKAAPASRCSNSAPGGIPESARTGPAARSHSETARTSPKTTSTSERKACTSNPRAWSR